MDKAHLEFTLCSSVLFLLVFKSKNWLGQVVNRHLTGLVHVHGLRR